MHAFIHNTVVVVSYFLKNNSGGCITYMPVFIGWLSSFFFVVAVVINQIKLTAVQYSATTYITQRLQTVLEDQLSNNLEVKLFVLPVDALGIEQ